MDLIVHNYPLKDGGGHLRLALVHGEVVDECHWLLDRSSAESFDFAFTASEDEWVQARATLLEPASAPCELDTALYTSSRAAPTRSPWTFTTTGAIPT